MKYGNLFYFRSILKIGGIERYFQNLTEEYKDRDITVVCKDCDHDQYVKLRKKCRVIFWDGKETFECKNFFTNFNLDLMDYVKADKYYLVLHGDYKDMVERKQLTESLLPRHEKIDEYIAISQHVAKTWYELTGIKCKVCYNPPTKIEKIDKPTLRLISAQRLSQEKGGYRIAKLIEKLDEYCERNKVSYRYDIYTNDEGKNTLARLNIKSSNVAILNPRQDVEKILWQYDYFISLTDNEGYCYSVVEALCSKVPCVVTPLPVFKEIGLNDRNSITLNYDLSNVDEVVNKMFNLDFSFHYEPKNDVWWQILARDKKTYEGGNEKMAKVKANCNYEDLYEHMHVVKNQVYETTQERAEQLTTTICQLGIPFATLVEEPKPETPKRKRAKK